MQITQQMQRQDLQMMLEKRCLKITVEYAGAIQCLI